MSNKDIGDIYKGMLKGDPYTPSPKMNSLYESVYVQQNESIEIDGIPRNAEDTVFLKTTDGWKGYRVGMKVVAELHKEVERLEDKQQYMDMVLAQAESASIITANDGRRYFADVTGKLVDFVIDSAKLTKAEVPAFADKSIPVIAKNIIQNIKEYKYQKGLVDFMNTNKGAAFNLWDATDTALESTDGVLFDMKGHPHMKYMMPAGEEKAARGAAGPGEALLAFLYNGKKPKGAGDILLGCPTDVKCPEWTIELKYNRGRIGKNITAAKVRQLDQSLYNTKTPDIHKHLGIQVKDPTADVKTNPVYYLNVDGGVYITLKQISDTIKKLNTPPSAEDEVPVLSGIEKFLIDSKVIIQNSTEYKIGTKESRKPFLINSNSASAEAAKGSFAPSQSRVTEDLMNMTLDGYAEEYAGISAGKKNVLFSMFGGSITQDMLMSQILPMMPGMNDRIKLDNLTGGIHLKNYLTHIEPFTWLVVYKDDGDARSISHDNIVKMDLKTLVDTVHDNGLRFGYRNDEGGYDLQFA